MNNVKMSDPTLKPTITIVDGICAAARSSALRSVAKIPFSNLAIYGNRYWNISIHIPRITASTIRIILYILSLPLFRTPMIRKSTNSSMAMTAMTSQQMVAGLKFLSLPDCQLPKISYLNRLYLLNLITFQDAFPRRVVMIPPSIFERVTVFGTTFSS